MSSIGNSIGTTLLKEFDQVKKDIEPYHEDWLDYASLHKFGLLHADSVRDNRKISINLVRTKIKAISARLLDFQFPSSGALNFSIKPTPVPTMSKAVKAMIIEYLTRQAEAEGREISAHELEAAIRKAAQESAKEMQLEMADQLAESPGKIGFREVSRRVINSGLIYGTGVLKGPLVTKKTRKRWTVAASDYGDMEWDLEDYEGEIAPYMEAVSIWNFFPDMGATDQQHMRFAWQKHLYSRSDLLELANKDRFKGDVILEHIGTFPDGDAKLSDTESRLRELSGEVSPSTQKGFYTLYERWGFLTGTELRECGVDIKGDDLQDVKEYASNVWLLGDKVIKAVIAPVNGVPVPYFMWYYNKDETSILGTGVAEDIKTLQIQINKAADGMMDNAEKAGGPQIGLNMSALKPDQWADAQKITKDKVWLFSSAEEMDKLMKIWTLPNYSEQYQNLISFLQNFIDEQTAPRFISGDGRVPGAGDTASGLSMLMGAMHINLKEPTKSWDDNIIIPFITALYHWNMTFNPKNSVKGDFDIIAEGSSSMIQKEVMADKLSKAIEVSSHPKFDGKINDDDLLKELFNVLDLSEDLVKTKEQIAQDQYEKTLMQVKAQLQATVEALEVKGIPPEQVIERMFQQAYMQQQQMGGAPPEQQPEAMVA